MIYILSIGTAFLTTALTSIFMIKSGYFVFDKGETLTPIEIPTDNETQKAHAKEAEAEISEADSADESAKQTDMSQNGTESVRADKSSAFYGRSQSFMAIMLMLIVSMLVNYLLYTYTIVQNTDHMYNLFAKMALTHAMTICAALTDAKRNKIPNAIIAFGLGARAVLYVAEFMFYNDGFTAMLKNDILGFIIGFVMLFIIAFISKGGIGYGDIKLFGVKTCAFDQRL